MDALERVLKRAGDELGAALTLADAYPLQAMEMLAASVRTAVHAACLREFDFDRGTPFRQMVGAVCGDVYARTSPGELAKVDRSCEAWMERGVEDGDFLKALEADLEIVAAFICDVEDWAKTSLAKEAAFA